MRNLTLVSAFSLLLISFGVQAQPGNSTSTTAETSSLDSGIRGWRVKLLKPVAMAMLVTEEIDAGTFSTDPWSSPTPVPGISSSASRYPDILGVAVGYSSLPIQQAGWIIDLGVMNMTVPLPKPNAALENSLLRLEADLAYAMSSSVYLKAGLNLSSITSLDDKNSAFESMSSDFGTGIQAGAGYQLGRNFAIELAYLEMKQSVELAHKAGEVTNPTGSSSTGQITQNGKLTFRGRGAEISVIGTF